MLKPTGETRPTLGQRLHSLVFDAPWKAAAFLGRVLYGFHVEGQENLPPQGPYIITVNEQGLLSTLISGYISIVLLHKEMESNNAGSTAFMQEELFAFDYFRNALGGSDARGQYRALIPHAAGRLALGLLDGYRTLKKGGIVIINPEGDATWDGLPLPVGHSLPWLALHTAAPIVPTLTTSGCYEIWPRWQRGPSRRGRLKLVVGKPLQLCDEPMAAVSQADLLTASARLRKAFDEIAYGPGGVRGWAGPTLKDGRPVDSPVDLGAAPAALEQLPVGSGRPIPASKRGVTQLLWQCPVCQTDEALLHERPRFRVQTARCQACGTKWRLDSVPGSDFRLKVLAGEPHLVGLDMPLSAWYAQMKRRANYHAIDADGMDLLADESVYLTKDDVPLLPYRPNALFDGWAGREPPKAQLVGKHEYADWDDIGSGRLSVTNQRLLWQNQHRELDFFWSEVTAVYQFMSNILAIKYGDANYRFDLGGELALKWLAYAGKLAEDQAAKDGHELSVTWH